MFLQTLFRDYDSWVNFEANAATVLTIEAYTSPSPITICDTFSKFGYTLSRDQSDAGVLLPGEHSVDVSQLA